MTDLHDSATRLTSSLPPEPARNVKMISVCAGHRLGGAPRRNRTGDPILTMEPPGTAVRTAVSPRRARPSGPKLSVLLRRRYALTLKRLPAPYRIGVIGPRRGLVDRQGARVRRQAHGATRPRSDGLRDRQPRSAPTARSQD